MPVSHHFESQQTAENSTTALTEKRERRRSTRDGVHGEPARAHLVALILGTYASLIEFSGATVTLVTG